MALVSLHPPDVVADRFELEALAGVGGMGSVYRALDRHTGVRVALKLLSSAEGPAAERFAREADVLSQLAHPAIVEHVAHGVDRDGRAYLAMEWLDGEDLAARLARGRLSIADTLTLGRRIAEALAAAHAIGLIHRDVKPANILLPGGDVAAARVVDFGIARFGNRAMTRTGVMIGTPGYMAPEQARGERTLDAGCDLFSLGAVLYECLTGTPAFPGDNVMAVLARVLLDEPRAVSAFVPDVPAALDDVVRNLLAKERSARPASAQALALALSRIDLDGVAATRVEAVIGRREQRWVSIVLARIEAPRALEQADTLAPEDLPTKERLAASVAALDARVDVLVDGSILASMPTTAAAHDAAVRAARCALAFRRALGPAASIAIVTGRGVHGEALPLGEVIDRGVALLALAPALAARIDDTTGGLVESRFEVLADEHGSYLGPERPVDAGTRRLLGRPSLCVGRDRELGVLHGLLDECIAESVTRAVLVVAPAGTGKSRLRHELVARAKERVPELRVWLARADVMSAGEPFEMLAQLVRRAALIDEIDRPERARSKLASHVARQIRDEALAVRTTTFLAELLRVEPAGSSDPRLRAARNDARMMADQVAMAWDALASAELVSAPLLVVLEDLHWGDVATVQALDRVLRRRDAPLLMLATARPEIHDVMPRLWHGRDVTEMRLGPLSERASGRLVRSVLGDHADEATVARIVAHADGNAFFLEEMIRATATHGGVTGLPPTVLAMMQARIDALAEPDRRLLRAASIFGELFSEEGARALVGALPLEETMRSLVAQEIVEPRHERTGTYAFRHALVREAVYATLTAEDRRLGHLLAAGFLAASGERSPLVLAEHFERGGDASTAARWYVDAAREGLEASAFVAALAHATKALVLDPSTPLRGPIARIRAEAEVWRGQYAAGIACVHEALELLPANSDAWWRTVMNGIAALQRLGRLVEAPALIAPGLALPPTPESATARTMVLTRAAVRFHFYGVPGVNELLDEADRSAQLAPADDAFASAWVVAARATRAHAAGRFAEYLALQREVADRLEAAGDIRESISQREDVGWWQGIVGEPEESEQTARATRDSALRLGATRVVVSSTQAVTVALLSQRRWDEALATDRELRELVPDEPAAGSLVMTTLALLGLARYDDVLSTIENGRGLLGSERRWRIWACAVTAMAHARRGDAHAARAALEAWTESTESTDPWTLLLWDAARVEVAAAGGDADEARRVSAEVAHRIDQVLGRVIGEERRRAIAGYFPITLAACAVVRAGGTIAGVDDAWLRALPT